MKRLHLHIGVEDLQKGIAFYSALFATEPVKTKDDYAKWMLDDPCVNFAISTRVATKGVDHLGIQVDDASELAELRGRLSEANISTHSDGEVTCCYAKSEKSWVKDPSGVAWEAYHTMADAQIYATAPQSSTKTTGCCAPAGA